MKEIKILGAGCANTDATAKLIVNVAKEKCVDIHLESITDTTEILGYGVTATPGVVVDGRLAYSGGVPDKILVEEWLADSGGACCGCCGGKG